MMKLQVKLWILEKQVNEQIFQRKKDPVGRQYEKEFNIYTMREDNIGLDEDNEEIIIKEGWHKQYNRMKYDMEEKDESEKVNGWIKALKRIVKEEEEFEERSGTKVAICFGCQLPIDKEEEGEKLENIGKKFDGVCMDCENERIDLGTVIELPEDIEMIDENQETEEQPEEVENMDENQEVEEQQTVNERNKRKREDTDEEEENINGRKQTKRRNNGKTGINNEVINEIVEELTMEEKDGMEIEFLREEMEEGTLEQAIKEVMETSQVVMKSIREEIKKSYIIGKRFLEKVEEEREMNRNRDQRRKRLPEFKARKIVHDRLLSLMTENTTRKSLINILQQGEKIYKLFERMGKDKIKKVKRTSATKFRRLNLEEIEEIVRRVGQQERD